MQDQPSGCLESEAVSQYVCGVDSSLIAERVPSDGHLNAGEVELADGQRTWAQQRRQRHVYENYGPGRQLIEREPQLGTATEST